MITTFLTLEEFIKIPVPKTNVFSCLIKHNNGFISAMKSGYNEVETTYSFWDSTGTESLTSFNYKREQMFDEVKLSILTSIFDTAISGICCCCECHKPLFYRGSLIKINNWHQVWAGFYCDNCYDGSVMNTNDYKGVII